MKRWMTTVLVWAAVGAVLLIAARFVLPVMGLAGVEGEIVQPLVRLMPLSVLLLVGAVAAIVIDLRRQASLVDAGIARLADSEVRWKKDYVAEVKAQPGLYRFTGRVVEDAEVDHASVAEVATAIGGLVTKLPTSGLKTIDLDGGQLQAQRLEPNFAGEPVMSVALASAAMASQPQQTTQDPVAFNDPFAPMAEVSAENTGGDDELAGARSQAPSSDLTQVAAPPITTLLQLPSPSSEFAGRDVELNSLRAARGAHAAISLQGAGGVGKTTLALTLAHQFAGDYPDGQFYLDLKGVSACPLSAAEVQSHIIRAYLPTVRLPESAEEIDYLYHALLADKRALLLLDNAADSQQIAPLIAPGNCLSIITSRQYLSLPDLFIEQIEGLPTAEATELLRRLAPRVGEAATTLAALCGRLPLALRLATSALLLNPQLKPSDYAQQLEALQRGERSLKPVEAALEISYELLPVGLPSMWRMLSIFADTFDANAAAAIWRAHPTRAAAGLDHLTAYSLIERNVATGRFRLHDLMAAFADAHLAEAEREAARQLHAGHYQSVLHEADAFYEQGGEMMRLGLELVDREWHNIHAGQTWAALHKDHNRTACELCSSYSGCRQICA